MKYIIGVLAIVVLAVVAVVLIAMSIGGGSSKKSNTSAKAPVIHSLVEQDNADSTVILTTQGWLVGENQRRAVRVTVTQSERKVEALEGYDGRVIKSQTFPNSAQGYSTFLRALENAGFTKYRKDAPEDERAYCPQGYRYIYQLQTKGDRKQRLWSSSCTTADGNFAGSAPKIRDLFFFQIPGYSTFTSDVNLSQT